MAVRRYLYSEAATTQHSLLPGHTDCFIQLRLTLASKDSTSDNPRTETVNLELTMQQFNELLQEMEKIHSTLSILG